MQEGKMLEKPDFDLKGLMLKKTSTNKHTRDYFLPLLRKELVETETIDLPNFLLNYI